MIGWYDFICNLKRLQKLKLNTNDHKIFEMKIWSKLCWYLKIIVFSCFPSFLLLDKYQVYKYLIKIKGSLRLWLTWTLVSKFLFIDEDYVDEVVKGGLV